MRSKYLIGLLVAVALVAAAMWGQRTVSSLREQAARQKGAADMLRAEARQWQVMADGYQQQAEALYKRAAKRDTVIMTRYRETLDTLTIEEDCEEVAEFFSVIVDTLSVANAELESAYEHQKMATGAMLAQVRGLEHAYDSLATAYETLARPPARSLFKKLVPDVRPGVFAGVCTTGTPCAGVGITLSWSF